VLEFKVLEKLSSPKSILIVRVIKALLNRFFIANYSKSEFFILISLIVYNNFLFFSSLLSQIFFRKSARLILDQAGHYSSPIFLNVYCVRKHLIVLRTVHIHQLLNSPQKALKLFVSFH
jgi:hypothetical protein